MIMKKRLARNTKQQSIELFIHAFQRVLIQKICGGKQSLQPNTTSLTILHIHCHSRNNKTKWKQVFFGE
jgi:hypothetical protein